MKNYFLLKKCKLVIKILLSIFLIFDMQCNYKLKDNNSKKSNNIKVLILILASDDLPIYIELQKIWRQYMHKDRHHVEVYFIKADPNLISLCQIDGDIIWSRTIENYNPGMINKTILSMEFLLQKIKEEFDYVVRTNLSSFYVFSRLLNFLKECPRAQFYSGIGHNNNIASGCGLIISSDVAEHMILHKKFFLDNISDFEDVLIGKFLEKEKILLRFQKRMDFYNTMEWHAQKNNIADDIFHFRIKNSDSNLRINDDIHIHSNLLKMFYS